MIEIRFRSVGIVIRRNAGNAHSLRRVKKVVSAGRTIYIFSAEVLCCSFFKPVHHISEIRRTPAFSLGKRFQPCHGVEFRAVYALLFKRRIHSRIKIVKISLRHSARVLTYVFGVKSSAHSVKFFFLFSLRRKLFGIFHIFVFCVYILKIFALYALPIAVIGVPAEKLFKPVVFFKYIYCVFKSLRVFFSVRIKRCKKIALVGVPAVVCDYKFYFRTVFGKILFYLQKPFFAYILQKRVIRAKAHIIAKIGARGFILPFETPYVSLHVIVGAAYGNVRIVTAYDIDDFCFIYRSKSVVSGRLRL